MKDLPQSYYLDDNPFKIAQDLLGKILCTCFNGIVTSGRIVELEVYKAPEDRGSHAYQNKRTPRTETMFKAGGIAYIYLCYGLHHMFNVVSGPEGIAHAILIRALEPVEGIETMQFRRKTSGIRNLTNGPGKLCQAMGITTDLNGYLLYEKSDDIRLLSDGFVVNPNAIYTGPRVGIAYAKQDAQLPYRYYMKQNPFVSRPLIVNYPNK